MSIKHNEPRFTDETTMACRGCIEHRATWMALFYEQAKKMGIDAEKMEREAIYKCGTFHADTKHIPACADVNSAAAFGDVFFSEQGKKIMEVDIVESDENHVIAHFHQCPLVQAWEKLGYEGEDLTRFCDMAMDGDRGIAKQFGMTMDLEKTIAAGDGLCRVHYHK